MLLHTHLRKTGAESITFCDEIRWETSIREFPAEPASGSFFDGSLTLHSAPPPCEAINLKLRHDTRRHTPTHL